MAIEHCEASIYCRDIYPNGTRPVTLETLRSVGFVLTKYEAAELGGLLRRIAAKSPENATIDLTGHRRRRNLVKVTRRRPSRGRASRNSK